MAELTRDLNAFQEERDEIEDLTSFSVAMETFFANIIQFHDILFKYVNLINHSHKCHNHFYKHSILEITDSCEDLKSSGYSCKKVNPKLEYLSHELYAKQDLTSNNKLYGVDFYFKNDLSTPAGVRFINSDTRFDKTNIHITTWDRYISYVLNSILNCPLDFNLDEEHYTYEKTEIDIIEDSIIKDSDIINITKNLTLEVKYNYDFDGNNFIYGYDFIILEINEQSKYLNTITGYIPHINPIKIFTLDQYLKSIHVKPDIPIMTLKVPHILEPELILILIQEILTGIDVDGDGYVYGKDILILDPPPALSTYIPPFIPLTTMTWNAYKQCYIIFLEVTSKIRTSDYYAQRLLIEFNNSMDADYNNLIYNIDFIITDDIYKPDILKHLPENLYLPPISFKDYIDTLPFTIFKNTLNSAELCVKLAHEFSNRENLVDVDINGMINGIDFIISDCDPNKFESLISLEKSTMFSVCRDLLKYIKCKYFLSKPIIHIYTQLEFDQYWFSINGILIPPLIDITQDIYGRTIQNNQITCICYPIWISKTLLFPLFIPILSLYDLEQILVSQTLKSLSVLIVGQGNVDSIPKYINCGFICSYDLPFQSRVILFAYPKYGYEFKEWSGFDNCDNSESSTIPTISLIMFYDKIITATFILKTYILDISFDSGYGIIADSNLSILCTPKSFLNISNEFDLYSNILDPISWYNYNGSYSANVQFQYDKTLVIIPYWDTTNNTISLILRVGNISSIYDSNSLKCKITGLPTSYTILLKDDSTDTITIENETDISIIFTYPPSMTDGLIIGNLSSLKNIRILTSDWINVDNIRLIHKSGFYEYPIGTPIFIDSNINYKYELNHGTIINLDFTLFSGLYFEDWVGVDSSIGINSSLTLLSNRSISIKTSELYYLIINTILDTSAIVEVFIGTVKQSPTIKYLFKENTEVIIYITPSNPYKIDRFEGADSSIGNTCIVNMTSSRIVDVYFSLKQFYLTIIKTGGSGVVSDLSGVINCGSICKSIFTYGSIVTLNAFPDENYLFINWNGSDNDSINPICIVTMNTNRNISATFNPIIKTLTLQKIGNGFGDIKNLSLGIDCGSQCIYSFIYNTSITLDAIPNFGSVFTSWTGADLVGGDRCSITLITDSIITAGFRSTFDLNINIDDLQMFNLNIDIEVFFTLNIYIDDFLKFNLNISIDTL